MKIEYGKREFNNEKMDIVSLTNKVITKASVMLEEKQINIKFSEKNRYMYMLMNSILNKLLLIILQMQ